MTRDVYWELHCNLCYHWSLSTRDGCKGKSWTECDKSLPSLSLFTVYWSMIRAHLHGVNSKPLKIIGLW